ncbi:MAG: outer membrane lipoprotein-sorting protein [Gammaproteobacteria bacterium]|nr:outer membrane lipoprotein-sorting protein [Gammaproteobacteria bacterium]MCP4490999.1 outer membrane lipoprotein-sorting protein [Gammaproteobacteria bacterium]
MPKILTPSNQTRIYLFCSFIVFGLSAFPASAQTAEQKGLDIAKAAQAYDEGFGDFTADMVMTLKTRKGDTSTRNIRIRTLEVQGDGDKSLSIFDEPNDVKGTAMLTYSHGLEPDDQWLYLPALKKVKRINSRNKSGPFMGSTFAFEDLSSQEVEKYTYKLIGEESCGDWQCFVTERVPAYKHSGYTRQVAWIDKEGYRMMKVEYYDRKKALLKTLTTDSFQQYLGHYWRPSTMDMINHQNGKSTRLEWKNYQFQTGLSDRDFRSQALKRLK